jgi:hypothetical protein
MRTQLLVLIIAALILASACQRVVLDERFHNTQLTNWMVIDDPDTVEGPSIWRVEPDGWLHQRSNIWGKRGDFLGRWYGTYLVAGNASWSDYEFSLKAKPEDDDGFGVVFRFRNPEHFYRLLFIQDEINGGPLTRLDKRDGADYIELWSLGRGYEVGAETSITIEAIGNRLRGWVNGRQLFELKDGSYRRGKIGLFCYAQNGQAFDDVKVTLK